MKLRTILAGSAIAALAFAADFGTSSTFFTVPRAEAAATVSVSLFYNELGRHGDWVRYNDDYVFIPGNVRAGWRPYTEGRWVYADDFGWTWASDESFGWATYHYGRWGYGEDIGWYWVPGTRWAPAWVSWRRDNDHVIWAPLPPRRGGRDDADINVTVNVGDIPSFFWVAVPTRRFLEPNIRTVVIRDDRELRRVVQRADFVGTVRIRNNIVVNNVIDIRVIERDTGQRVRRVEARRTDNPRDARATGDQVVVFDGEVRRERDARPERVREAREVRKVTRERASADEAAPEETTGTNNAAQETPEASPNQRPRRQQATGSDSGDAVQNGNRRSAADQQEESNAPAAKPRRQQNNTAENAGGNDEPTTAPAQRKKRQRAEERASQKPAASRKAAEETNEPVKKKQAVKRKQRQDANEGNDATGSTGVAAEENNTQAKQKRRPQERRKQRACDPNDAGCQPN